MRDQRGAMEWLVTLRHEWSDGRQKGGEKGERKNKGKPS